MVKVRCLRCGGRAEGATPAEASMRIDHSIGLGIGKPCLGYPKAPTEVVEAGTEKPAVEIKTKPAELMSEDKPKPKKKSIKKD